MSLKRFIGVAQKAGRFCTHQVLRGEPTLAYVGGWLGKRNLGDELLYAAYGVLFPQVSLMHYDGGRVADRFYRMTPRRRGGVLGGGTLVGQHPMWLEYSKAFGRTRDPFFVFGSGVADPAFWPDGAKLSDWKPCLQDCAFRGVRGPRSAGFLADAGVENVEIVGDPAVVFARNRPNPDYLPQSLVLNIGVADQRMHGSADKVREEMIKLAVQARRAGWRVDWLVVWPKDLATARAAAEASDTAASVHEVYEDHEEFIDRASQASVMVGMKLHATVLGTCAATPSLMLEYRTKCRDYMESIGHGDFVIRTDEFEAGSAWERVVAMDAERTVLADRLAVEVGALQTRQKSMADRLAAKLGLS